MVGVDSILFTVQGVKHLTARWNEIILLGNEEAPHAMCRASEMSGIWLGGSTGQENSNISCPPLVNPRYHSPIRCRVRGVISYHPPIRKLASRLSLSRLRTCAEIAAHGHGILNDSGVCPCLTDEKEGSLCHLHDG